MVRAWGKPRTIFDLPALKAAIKDLENTSAQPQFWDQPETAQTTLQELNDLKSQLMPLKGLARGRPANARRMCHEEALQ